jgi:ABC-type multidrug transport system ATPase subunit
MLELLDLTDLRGRLPQTLSWGQRQRLAVGRTLVHDPALLLFDEPLLALDEVGQVELAEVLVELRALGKTMVLASRSPGSLYSLADSVYSLDHGELKAEIPAEPPGARVRLAVLGAADGLKARLAERLDVADVLVEEPAEDGAPTRLTVGLRDPNPAAVAEIVRTIVESGESVVEVYAELGVEANA